MASEQHAFISYVREDLEQVNELQALLEEAGVRVWRDTEDLWPGEDWRLRIRQAITDGALVFIACFSNNSASRETTYQNEELLLAIEQFRRRPPDRPWLIPLRFSDCDLPQYDLGAGRTLNSLQRVDLFGAERDRNIARLVGSVLGLQGPPAAPSAATAKATSHRDPTSLVKSMLPDPSRQIELEDFVMSLADTAALACSDADLFPAKSEDMRSRVGGVRLIVGQTEKYWEVLEPLLRALIAGCTWGRPQHSEIWARAVERVTDAEGSSQNGQSELIHLRRFPILPLLYGCGLASLDRQNFDALRSIAVGVEVRRDNEMRPLIGAAHVWRPFEHTEIAVTVLARKADNEDVTDDTIEALYTGREGKRLSPVSDYLCRSLRPFFSSTISNDLRFEALFDRLEIFLNVLATDAKAQAAAGGRYLDGTWLGRFVWHGRHRTPPIEVEMLKALEEEREDWPPLRVGLFGGKPERAEVALESFGKDAEQARQRVW